ncbi:MULTISPECIES: DUF3248 domain-containing protein [Deinococcus]|uniref:DUF3248 domain-containing protein n=1 Tax=Deinococcus multiflagellatus TaxID=1656887 RepID=A0ABW1ZM44_9DEIO|nr:MULTISPECIES: DUF3248 domain-containing protein [Deinococcus]MBZ9713839.1 DUF3248 domain-containing protein [Deinococcus multiflagellatus]
MTADPPGTPAPIPPELARALEALGGQLVWRMGKDEASDDVVVRLGFASATPRFAHLPRLRSAADAELQAALAENRVVIEWVE